MDADQRFILNHLQRGGKIVGGRIWFASNDHVEFSPAALVALCAGGWVSVDRDGNHRLTSKGTAAKRVTG